WVVNSVDPAATVYATERLQGGISSLVHGVSLQAGARTRHFVLRRFDNARWLEDEPGLARHEAESLRRATQANASTPQIIAFDETGSDCGVPAVLMTRLAGTVVLNPRNKDTWLDGLAGSLARIHAVSADGFPYPYFTYTDLATLETPSWSRLAKQWDTAIAIAQKTRPVFPSCFIHRDYHPANVLWHGDTVSGIVDWVNACAGPAAIDVAHCRVNLAQLFGVPTADLFLSAYEKHAGTAFSYDPYWDIVALMDILDGPPTVYAGWTALGVTGLTDELMRVRIDEYLLSLVARASDT
ncbi:MAG: aminoglycoside phosphotransferase family protein, partial [Fibrella sp.]|nr:aminoglycoside phosphotransferase family protein [Armatimonadota bacterium]